MPAKRYRYLGSAEGYIPAIEKVVQSGEEFESEIELTGPFQTVDSEVPQQKGRPVEPDEVN